VSRVRTSDLRALAGAGVGLVAVLAIWAWGRGPGSLPGEDGLYRWTRDRWHDSVPLQHLAQFWTDLGTAPVAVLTVGFAAAIVARNVDVPTGLLVVGAAGAAALAEVLKHVLGGDPAGVAPSLGTYPSGHVAYATGVFGLLALLGHRYGRPEVLAVCVVLIFGMGPATVAVAGHSVSDVLGGYACGLAWLGAVVWAGSLAGVEARRRPAGGGAPAGGAL
jgi:membrane-associated phospholipid phosphatase